MAWLATNRHTIAATFYSATVDNYDVSVQGHGDGHALAAAMKNLTGVDDWGFDHGVYGEQTHRVATGHTERGLEVRVIFLEHTPHVTNQPPSAVNE